MIVKREDATVPQIEEFARQHGLDVQAGMTKAEINALIDRAGIDATEIDVEDEAPRRRPRAKPQDGIVVDEASLVDKYVTILIPVQEGAPERETPSVNGEAMVVVRGQPQRIRYPYLVALMNAQAFVYAETEQGALGKRQVVASVPVTIIDGDPEVLAFLRDRKDVIVR